MVHNDDETVKFSRLAFILSIPQELKLLSSKVWAEFHTELIVIIIMNDVIMVMMMMVPEVV
jgi:hypothetical protein